MAIQVTVRAPRVWEWARSATEDVIKLAVAYTKSRAGAARLRFRIVELNVQAEVDVSGQQVGTTMGYQVSINVGRQPVQVQATENVVTIAQAGGSATLTPATGKAIAIDAASCAWSVRVGAEPWPFNPIVVGAEAFTVDRGQSPTDSCVYYEVNAADVVEQLTLVIEELDQAGNVIDSGQASIEHAKPFQPVVGPSSVEVNWVG